MSEGAIPTFDEFVKNSTQGPTQGPTQGHAPPHPASTIPSFDEFSKAPPSLLPGNPGSEPAERFVSNFASAVNPFPGIVQMAKEATNPQIGLRATLGRHLIDPQVEQLGKARKAAQGTGEFEHMSVPGRISSAIGHGAAGVLPLVGPAAANAGEQIGSGDVAGGLGTGAGLVTATTLPDILSAGGRGLQRTAEPIAENAMGIRNVDRAPAKAPGRAALDYTSGVRPSSVSESAGNVIGDLSTQRNQILANSPAQVSLAPARAEVESAIGRAAAGNSDIGHLVPMREQLNVPRPGFTGATGPAGISEFQSPSDFLPIRQRFGEDFTKFDVARPVSNETRAVGNRVYGKLTNELHSTVPESALPDEAISNLIPVRDATRARDLNAGLAQRFLGRFGAHTGALAGGLYGASIGGLPGAVAGIAIPELLADPTVQMTAARGINAAGEAAQSPFIGRPAQVLPFIRPQKEPQQ